MSLLVRSYLQGKPPSTFGKNKYLSRYFGRQYLDSLFINGNFTGGEIYLNILKRLLMDLSQSYWKTRGTIEGPARSPDGSSRDFFYEDIWRRWSIKLLHQNLQDMKNHMSDEKAKETEKFILLLRKTRGHFEHSLKWFKNIISRPKIEFIEIKKKLTGCHLISDNFFK